MEKQTLLQKALQKHNKNRKPKLVNDEEYELCVSYAKGELSFNTVVDVLGLSSNNSAYPILTAAFKRYVSENPTNN